LRQDKPFSAKAELLKQYVSFDRQHLFASDITLILLHQAHSNAIMSHHHHHHSDRYEQEQMDEDEAYAARLQAEENSGYGDQPASSGYPGARPNQHQNGPPQYQYQGYQRGPQPEYEGVQNQGQTHYVGGPPPQATHPYQRVQQPLRRKSLLIGINYVGSQHALRGCQQDVDNMREFLSYKGYPNDPGSQVVMRDDRNTDPRGPVSISMRGSLLQPRRPLTLFLIDSSSSRMARTFWPPCIG